MIRAVFSLVICFILGCIPAPPCDEVGGACVFGANGFATDKELLFVEDVVSKVFGIDGLDGWEIHLYDDVLVLREAANDERCITGTVLTRTNIIYSTPEALTHETIHIVVYRNTNGMGEGVTHAPDTGWLPWHTDLDRKITSEVSSNLPYKSELACKKENRGK